MLPNKRSEKEVKELSARFTEALRKTTLEDLRALAEEFNKTAPDELKVTIKMSAQLPNSPSDCHAPFKSPVAKRLWSPRESPAQTIAFWESIKMNEEVVDAFARSAEPEYALAQQAEFRDKHLHHMASELVAMAEHDFDDNSWAALLKLTEQAKLILPYLNPPTP